MLSSRRRFVLTALVGICAVFGLLRSSAGPLAAAEDIPRQLSDEAFWQLATDFSEGGGYFRSDNFVSNEVTFQYVIPQLKRHTKPGGVYLGVGPDQNFTYLVALQPRIAFIFDIRRQNMMEHLMYKALFEMSADRVEFASRLFSRKRPPNLAADVSAEDLFKAYDSAPPDPQLFGANLKAIMDRLEKEHGFKLTADDERMIQTVYQAFFRGGPDINYNFAAGGGARGRMPTYEDLMIQDDGEGQNRSYMASDPNFQFLRMLQRNNLIIPLVGDFAGEKAVRAVGKYLKERDATVTAFYLSNVEQYLFQDADNWKKFYTNVGTLPLDETSTFIRSFFYGMGYSFPPSSSPYGMRSENKLCSMMDTVKAFAEGRIMSYADVINMSK